MACQFTCPFFLLSFFMLTTTTLQYDYMLQKQELNEDICCSSVFTIIKHLPDCLAIESYLSLNQREKNLVSLLENT